ncbi:MAG: hypothetical protein NTY71_02875 [Methanoregula sp.]|jgi:hypothetical protein|nr:hypothetical protein [Methanoregula sp.]
MKIHELLDNVLKGSRYLGTFDLSDLLQFASSREINGVAVAKGDGREFYIAFVAGEAEGAIYVDGKGVLFGDTAVLMIQVKESFVLTETTLDVVEALVMGCRIFDKNRLKKTISCVVPEIGGPSGGIGILSIIVKKEGVPQNGIRVSIRKDGKIVGSDVTTNDGTVGFRVAYGVYDCIVQDKAQVVTKYRIEFDASHTFIPLVM